MPFFALDNAFRFIEGMTDKKSKSDSKDKNNRRSFDFAALRSG
jgi:hypothetical protein